MVSTMKCRLFPIIIALIIIISTPLTAKTNANISKLLESYKKLNTWQATLSQTNYYKQSGTSLKSSGSMYFKQGSLAIRYTKPMEQALLVQDGKVTIYDKSANTVLKTRLQSAVQSLNPAEIISAYCQNSTITKLSSRDSVVTYSLKPLKDDNISEIRFSMYAKTGYVQQLTYFDKQQNYVKLEFTKMKVNQPISPSVWKLSLPKNVRVLEN
jgi:outer membrane lipoprotein-sorting protein